MKNQFATIFVLTAVLALAVRNEAEELVKLCTANRHYVEFPNGTPIFLVGYNAHNTDIGSSIGYPRLIELNARNRVNYMRFFPTCAGMLDNKGSDTWLMFRRVAPEKVDLEQWNEAYWPQVRQCLKDMQDHGIVAHVSIFERCLPWKIHPFNPRFNINADLGDLDHNHNGNGLERDEFFDFDALTNPQASPAQKVLKRYQERIVEKMLAATSPFPNVMYEIGNELPDPGMDWVQYWVKFIRSRSNHLITYNGSEGLTAPGLDGATDHVSRESRVRTPFSMAEFPSDRWVASSSDGGEITSVGADAGRRCLWKAFTAGIGGWLNYSTDFYVTDADMYYYSAESPSRFNLRKGLGYANAIGFIQDWGLPFPRMKPQPEVILSKPASVEAFCLAGQAEYVVYLCGEKLGGQIALDLQPESTQGYWFNPQTGAYFQSVTVQPGKNILSIPAAQHDLVFYAGGGRTELREWHVEHAQTASPTVAFEFRNRSESLAPKSVRAEYSSDALETFVRCPKVLVEGGDQIGAPLRVQIPNLPFGKAQAARNWIQVTVSTASGRPTTCTFPVAGSDTAFVQLGESNFEDGLHHLQCADGGTTPAYENNRDCRRNAEPVGKVADRFLYFAVDDSIAYAGNAKRLHIRVTYLDVPDGTLELQYDAVGTGTDQIYRSNGTAPFTGSGEWRTYTFDINDAYLADRQNSGADFRFFIGKDKVAYLSRVELTSKPE